MKMLSVVTLVIMSIFNFDEYLEIFRILFYQVLPVVLILLTIYTVWGIFNDMKMEEDEKGYEDIERLREV